MVVHYAMTISHADADAPTSPCRLHVARSRTRRWHRRRSGTAAIAFAALFLASTAWLSLVFSGSTSRCWRRLKDLERRRLPLPLPWRRLHDRSPYGSGETNPPPLPLPPPWSSTSRRSGALPRHSNRSLSESGDPELLLRQVVFGIAGSSQLWKRRKELVRLWWRPSEMRGHVWLEEQVTREEGDESLPPILISEDTSRFRYTNPTGHPSGLRLSRIVVESFRLGLPDVRWFVLGDDDTIFNADNLVAVLRKYDQTEMFYIGSPSESHSANSYFSHSMAYGGGGIAISYPLAEALSRIHDDCLERYPELYGSDDRLHACITELGVPLTKEPGFHQWDIRGNAHGLLSSHPISPFVSIHHVEAVNPFYPGLGNLDSLKLFAKAMAVDPRGLLQRSICYDHSRRLTFSVSLGYVVQVFPGILPPRELERSERTYSAWNRISHRNEFDLDIRDPYTSRCKKPVLFFLKDIGRRGNGSLGLYARSAGRDDLKRKVFCFPRSLPLAQVRNIQVVGYPLRKSWILVPRRLCCQVNQPSIDQLRLTVQQCGKRFLSALTSSVRLL